VKPLPRLSLREVSVLLHLESGASYKHIALALERHPRIVERHVARIARKLPGNGNPKEKVMLYCDRLLAANADVVEQVRQAAA
jgi:DNA-binding NarL/FixJ family response regulator